jgi:hypothetical protein
MKHIIGDILAGLIFAYFLLFVVFSTAGMVKFIAWCLV